jgi:hypothetical protein
MGGNSPVPKFRCKGSLSSRDMKRVVKTDLESDDVRQICVKCYTVKKFLDALPANVKVDSLSWYYAKHPKTSRTEVSKRLKQIGVRSYRISDPRIQIEGTIVDASSRKTRDKMTLVAGEFGLKLEDFIVRAVTISRGGAKAFLHFSTKEIRDEVDLRVKAKVLGLVAVSRDAEKAKEAYKMVSELNPSTYSCKFVVIEKKAVICASMD